MTAYNAPLIIKEKRLWLAFNFYGGCGLNLECLGFFLTTEYVSKALIIYFPFVSTDMAIATEMLGKTIFTDISLYLFISRKRFQTFSLVASLSQ